MTRSSRAEPPSDLVKTVTVGPFSWFFTNVNTAMGLAGHSHYAEVTLVYRHRGPRGFPAFASTYAEIQERLIALAAKPFRDHTNEDVASALWAAFDGWTHPVIDAWGGDFTLHAVELAVRGVPDAIGHADGLTRYTLRRPDASG